jgi:hypothetical protein
MRLTKKKDICGANLRWISMFPLFAPPSILKLEKNQIQTQIQSIQFFSIEIGADRSSRIPIVMSYINIIMSTFIFSLCPPK